MSALVCLYAIGITALVAATAAGVEWAVQGRIPTRHLWSAAMVCALLIPPLAIVQHARGIQRPAVSPAQSAFVEVVEVSRAAGAAMGSRERGSPMHTLRSVYHSVVDRVGELRARTILELWMVASLALIAWIAYGAMHWDRERREWEATELDGVSVHLSADTGPAVFGVLSQRIVLPSWVRTLAPECRQLMLTHEREHIAARDPQRLALALGALVLMPWNPALWWCAARMRRAIELDCDARVLRRHPSPRAYGYLLLQVAARGNNAGPLAVPLVNLLRLPSELELRLRAMTRPRTIGGRTALAGAACAVAAMSVAFTTPVPASTRPVIRNLVQAARARVAHGEQAVVRVGGTVLQLDSASASADGNRVSGRLTGLRVTALPRKLLDTIPSAVAEDSIQRLARQLAEQSRRLDSVRAHSDSLDAAMRTVQAAREVRVVGGTVRLDSNRRLVEQLTQLGQKPRDRVNAARMEREFVQSGAHIGPALAQHYPNLASDASDGTIIWIVADSSGKVLHTSRSDDRRSIISPEITVERFPDVDARDIDFMSMRNWTIGTRLIHVAWVGLKK